MSKDKKIYVVMESVGQYEDQHEYPVGAFLCKRNAEEFIKKNNDKYRDIEDKAMSIGFNVDDKKREAFELYLKDTESEEYCNKMVKALGDDIDDGEPIEDFDWDDFYDKEGKFEENKKLVDKYLRNIGLTERQMKDVKIYEKYHSYGYDGVPHQYLSWRRIKLMDYGF